MNKEPIHILLAEDDEDDRFFFKKALQDAAISADLDTVEDGQKLIDYLTWEEDNALPDIIFLDINMPRKNGIECLKELRALPKLKDVPILMFSTSADIRMIDETQKLGANRYVRKPSTIHAEAEMFQKLFSENWRETLQKVQDEPFLIDESRGLR